MFTETLGRKVARQGVSRAGIKEEKRMKTFMKTFLKAILLRPAIVSANFGNQRIIQIILVERLVT